MLSELASLLIFNSILGGLSLNGNWAKLNGLVPPKVMDSLNLTKVGMFSFTTRLSKVAALNFRARPRSRV